MIKAFVCSFLLLVLAMLAVHTGLLDLLASRGAFYLALILLLAVLAASFIVLGNPIRTGTKDDEYEDK